MITMRESIAIFFKGICRNRLSCLGATITTITFPLLLVGTLLDAMGVFHNQMIGAILYMVLTPLFLTGHAIFFFGFFLVKSDPNKKSVFSFAYFTEHFHNISEKTSFRKVILFSTLLAVGNFFIVLMVAFTGHHYSETPEFCGTLCHQTMTPEYVSYQNSPHSRVACVDCHVGPGLKWFVLSKVNGARQLVGMVTGNYDRPIKVPIHGLRPAQQTCEECHRPQLFVGEKLMVKDKYQEDETNTLLQTALLLKVGSGGHRGTKASGIHWHVSKGNKISYTYLDHDRQQISQVTLSRDDGSEIIYKNSDLEEEMAKGSDEGGTKLMDCVDCHTRPTHMYESASVALNKRITNEEISKEIPFIKQQAMAAIQEEYSSHEEAKEQISTKLQAWYQENQADYLKENKEIFAKAVASIQEAYTDNVFPSMKIGWDTYIRNIGHLDDGGCFRCHNDSFESADGETISQDCETCHIVMAEEEEEPEIIKTLRGEE